MKNEWAQYNEWLKQAVDDPAFTAELEAIREDDEEIRDRFYRELQFGTAGLRGVLGMGTNRMNVYTVRRATQGFADYLNQNSKNPSAAIAYDSRINSDVFARETARVLAANGITVHLYSELMPTPALSYAVRELGCDAGVVITASHNPARYNGYKAYGSDGSQLGPEAADAVTACINDVATFTGVRLCDYEQAVADGRIRMIPESFVQQYLNRVYQELVQPDVCAKAGLNLVFTPLNGAGNRSVRTLLKKAGVTAVTVVPEQEHPDGNFPTCPYPNPETKEALALGLALSAKVGADLLLATDPDADRVAVAVKAPQGYRILTGNESGVLLLDYLCTARKKAGTLPARPVAVKSVVSSKLADAVAKEHGVEMIDVLTGFKFIGEEILKLEQKGESERYIFGFEESCGYLSGGYVRDKDAVNASLLLVEMASAYKLEGRTLLDALDDIYRRHGVYRSVVENFEFEGADGAAKMEAIMAGLRDNPPQEIAGDAVVRYLDYLASLRLEKGEKHAIPLPRANILEYGLATDCTVIIRPSGTEPKIKIYYSLTADTTEEVEALAEKYRKACAEIVDA